VDFLRPWQQLTVIASSGFTAFGVGAGEIMASVQVAMIAGLPFTALSDAIIAHPTLAEGIGPLFDSAPSVIDAPTGKGK
jgi:hypothetical protein